MTAITNRTVELAWQIHAGEYDDLRRIVVASGGSWKDKGRYSGAPIAKPSHGMTVGIPAAGGDPATCYIQVAFVLFGQCWPLIPEVSAGMQIVKAEWARRSKLARAIGGQT